MDACTCIVSFELAVQSSPLFIAQRVGSMANAGSVMVPSFSSFLSFFLSLCIIAHRCASSHKLTSHSPNYLPTPSPGIGVFSNGDGLWDGLRLLAAKAQQKMAFADGLQVYVKKNWTFKRGLASPFHWRQGLGPVAAASQRAII